LLTVQVVVASALIFFAAAFTHRAEEHQRANIERASRLAERDAGLVSHAVWQLDRGMAEQVLGIAARDSGVICLRVHEATGVLGAPSTGRCDDSTGLHVLRTPVTHIASYGPVELAELEHWFDVAADRGKVFRDLLPLLSQLALFIAVLVLCSTLAFRYTVRLPLKRVAASLRAFHQHGERIPIRWQSNDELGTFIDEYNAGLVRQEQAERNLRAQVAFQMALHEAMPTPFAYLDEGLRLFDANPAFHRQLAIGREAVGRPLPEMLTGVDWDAIRQLTPGMATQQELVGYEVDGDDRGFSLACSPFFEQAGDSRQDVRGYVLVLQDITSRIVNEHSLRRAKTDAERALTDLRQTRASLLQADRLASLGSLVAGIAHEINTPIGNSVTVASHLHERLRVIRAQVEQGKLTRTGLNTFLEATAEACAILQRSLDAAAEQIHRFKEVAVDRTSERRRQFDLRRIVEDLLATHRPQLRHTRHQLEIDIPDGIVLDSYPGPLEQVLSNCFNNALLHGFDGIDAGVIRFSAERIDEGRVRLVAADNGHGIPLDHRHRVFDPFFTTRLGRGGSGLGMSVVYQLVTGILGGTVELDGAPGEGTRVIIEIPAEAPQAEHAETTPHAARV
jgi:signal transduction histidine kinase